MKENKGKKTNITMIVLVVAVIAVAVMGLCVVKLNSDKRTAIKKVEEIQNQNNDLNKVVSELQRKLDTIQETISSNGGTDNNSSTSNNGSTSTNSNSNKETIMSKVDAEKILKEKFDALEKLYLNPEEFFNTKVGEEIKDFEGTILKIGTNNLVEDVKNHLPMCIHYENGKYIILEGGGARAYNGFDKFEDVRSTEQTISATLKTKQTGPNDKGEWTSIDDKSSEFALVKSGDNWLMDNVNVTDFE